MSIREDVYEWLDDNHDQIAQLGNRKGAEWLLEHEDFGATRSTLRTYIQRWRSENDQVPNPEHRSNSCDEQTESREPEEPSDPEESLFLEGYLDRENAYYNEEDDVYVVSFRDQIQPIDGEDYRAIKRAYSNWDGSEDTIPEVCRKFGVSRSNFEAMKKALGWTHDSAPYSEEELIKGETKDGQSFREDYLRRREQRVYKDLQKAEWKETQKEAKKWRKFEEFTIKPLLRGLKDPPLREPRSIAPEQSPGEFAAQVFETDRHLNKQTKHSGFDRHVDLWHRCTDDLVSKMTRYCQPGLIYLVLGSDLFHVDSYDDKTTAGTAQRVDLPQRKAVRRTADEAVSVVEKYRDVAPVVLRVIPGNHDRRTSMVFLWGLRQRYENCEDVEVRGDCEPYQYEKFGENLLGWHHGDGIGGGQTRKESNLSSKMLSDVPGLIGETSYRYWFLGHEHHMWSNEGATLTEMAPTMTPQGEYEDREGFPEGHSVSAGWIFEADSGQDTRFLGKPV